MSAEVLHGDCLDVMPTLDADSVDAIVCDPPYGLAFMGKAWDHGVPGVPFWEAALRVAKPGAHLVAFGGTRTYHRLTCAIEDAGWEIRDCLSWMYGSGFPKSLDVSKAIDKAAGAERLVIGRAAGMGKQNPEWNGTAQGRAENSFKPEYDATVPATDAARQWEGWGTALKPAWEPIIVARKPLIGTVASNVQEHGTGALNINECRIGTTVETWPASRGYSRHDPGSPIKDTQTTGDAPAGRWPANVILDEESAALLDAQSGTSKSTGGVTGRLGYHGADGSNPGATAGGFGDTGGASRFFYTAKASRSEREEGLAGVEVRLLATHGSTGPATDKPNGQKPIAARNHHPTVKPIKLMRWLCRLVTPPNGLILDPFTGSGSTGCAAVLEGFRFKGIEREAEYVRIARSRIAHWEWRSSVPLLRAWDDVETGGSDDHTPHTR